ncbi:hypothetical protein J3R83DRAFT_5407 [Lanmaoa asiatica]|nr:hypothetical protein J3R83DRAFT_5407 [Lanmaoa asiatica]
MSDAIDIDLDLFVTPVDTPEQLAIRQEFQQALEDVRAQALVAPDDDPDLEEDRVIWCREWRKRAERLTVLLGTDLAREMRFTLTSEDIAQWKEARNTFFRWQRDQNEARERAKREREIEEAAQQHKDRNDKEQVNWTTEPHSTEPQDDEDVPDTTRQPTQPNDVELNHPTDTQPTQPSLPPTIPEHPMPIQPEPARSSSSSDEPDAPVATKDTGFGVIQIRRPRRSVIVEMPPRKRKRVAAIELPSDESDSDEQAVVQRVGSDRCSRCIARDNKICISDAGHAACKFCSGRRQGCSLVSHIAKVPDGSRKGKGKGRATAGPSNKPASTSIAPPTNAIVISSSGEDDNNTCSHLRSRNIPTSVAPQIEAMKSEVERWKIDVGLARENHQLAITKAQHTERHLKSVEDAARRVQKSLDKMLAEASGSGSGPRRQ